MLILLEFSSSQPVKCESNIPVRSDNPRGKYQGHISLAGQLCNSHCCDKFDCQVNLKGHVTKIKNTFFLLRVVLFINLDYFGVSCSVLEISAVEFYFFSNVMGLSGSLSLPPSLCSTLPAFKTDKMSEPPK